MADREKVINGLKLLAHWPDGLIITDKEKWIKPCCEMAVAMLKEQEPVEPTFKQDYDGIFVWACGACGAYMYHIYEGIDKAKDYAKYCRQCGKKVKWE